METVLRVAAVYVFLMVALRVMGKRDLGQLAPFDLVILLLIPEILSQMHKSGIERMSQVKWGILETDGMISFVPWDQGSAGQQREDQQAV